MGGEGRDKASGSDFGGTGGAQRKKGGRTINSHEKFPRGERNDVDFGNMNGRHKDILSSK